jgi:GGDEF domain-containing protein
MPEHTINDGIELAKSIYKAIDKSEHFIPEIQAAVGEKISIPENHRVSCSIGIAYEDTYNEERMNIALKHADMKLYAVKKNQKSNYSVWEN